MLELDREQVDRFFKWDPQDYPEYKSLIIGEGSIGGKARPLLFAKDVLHSYDDEDLKSIGFQPSIFIATGVFDEFISQPAAKSAISTGDYETIKRAFLSCELPKYVVDKIKAFLEDADFPLVVRSSSLKEDSIKYSFAGKYKSIFLANTDPTLGDRLYKVLVAIKKIYARVYHPIAVAYRSKHNIGDDKMAIIIMKASGSKRGTYYYYPTTAGVAFSKNYRPWSSRIKQEDGLIRMVFGYGTRCTGRWYARLFSLTDPNLRPEGNDPYTIVKYSQETFDVVNLKKGCFESHNINRSKFFLRYHNQISAIASVFTPDGELLPYSLLSSDEDIVGGKIVFAFQGFPRRYPNFFRRMRKMLNVLESKMGFPIDSEFTYEPEYDEIILVQARALWARSETKNVKIPKVDEDKVILRGNSMILNGVVEKVPYLILVNPDEYTKEREKYKIARLIGKLKESFKPRKFILVGPGRWGSTNPNLGVPVKYNEIEGCVCLVELGIMEKGFWPELSYGTHFFGDLELDGVLYMPVFVGKEGNKYHEGWFNDPSNYEDGPHPAIRVYKGSFSAYFSSVQKEGIVFLEDG